MRLRVLGATLVVPLLLSAASGRPLHLNGQPLAGPPIADSWVPLPRLWPLGVAPAVGSDSTALTLPTGESLKLRWLSGVPHLSLEELGRLGIKVERTPKAWSLSKPMAELTGLKVAADDTYSRIEWEVDRRVAWRWREDDRKLIVELGGAGGTWPERVGGAGVIEGLRLSTPAPGVVRLEIDRRCPTPVSLEADGRRFSLALPNRFSLDTDQDLAGDVRYRRHYAVDDSGPLTWHLLTIPRHSPYRVQVLAAGKDGRFAKAPVSQLAAEAGAAVAINAGYFGGNLPLGLLLKGGNVLTSPIYNRSLLALPVDRPPFISRTNLSLEVLAANGQSAEIEWVNYPRQRNSLAAYTEHYGARTGTKRDGLTWEVAIDSGGRIVDAGEADLAIPPGGVVLAGQGPAATWLKRALIPGELAVVRSKLDQLWPGVREAIAGGPTLVRDGQVVVNSAEEKFQPDIAVGRAPRTAVGLTEQGDWLWLVVDGRDPHHSRGLTLTELAELFLELGATQALNLDGGGSSTLVVEGRVVNRPSDGRERPVTTGLGLVPESAASR